MISIIVPIHNTKEKYLSKCIDSLLNQTLKNYEIILIDDGSDEKCSNFIDKYKEFKEITIIHKKNEGVGKSRNIGIDKAKNDYIVFIDSDDYVENNMCEIIEKCIIENNSPDIICFKTYIDFKNKIVQNKFMPYKQIKIKGQEKEEILLQIIDKHCSRYIPRYNSINGVWAKVYKREFIINNKLYFSKDLFNMEDLVYNLYAFQLANNIFYYDKAFYHYVKNTNSFTNNYTLGIIKNNEKVFIEIQKFIVKYNKNIKFEKALNQRIASSIKSYILDYYLGSNNLKYKDAKKEICKLIDKKKYIDALNNSRNNNLCLTQKIIYFCIRHKQILILKLITKIKRIRDKFFKTLMD